MMGLFVLLLALFGESASAGVSRFAVLIGNNQGRADEVTLRYAESDAERMYDVLKDVGGYRPENLLLLQGEDADTVRQSIVAMNERVRTQSNDEIVMVVYYSGHADASALHLGRTSLQLDELQKLVRGSAAEFRLLIVDACRSGAVTRVKGGAPVAPFALSVDEKLPGEGAVFLTSSSVNEDAQESDALKGSFFTHFFLSALLGAADENGDGNVDLAEAYRYAYDQTLRATSATVAGIQHPTFHYDFRGRGNVILTMPGLSSPKRAQLQLPLGRSYIVFRGGKGGPVIGELDLHSASRKMNLEAGPYYVVGRGPQHMVEGLVVVGAGETRVVKDTDLRRVEYAALVRKGGGSARARHALQGGYGLRTSVISGASVCNGGFLGYQANLRSVSLTTRVHACHSAHQNDILQASNDEVSMTERVTHFWDFPALSVELGVELGGGVLLQSFETPGIAPSRRTGAGQVGALVGMSRDLRWGLHLGADLSLMTYVFRVEEDEEPRWTGRVAPRLGVYLGKHW